MTCVMEAVARSLAVFQSHQVTVGELELLLAPGIYGNIGTQVTRWIIFNRRSLASACSLFQLHFMFENPCDRPVIYSRLSGCHKLGWWMLGKQPQPQPQPQPQLTACSPSLRHSKTWADLVMVSKGCEENFTNTEAFEY